MALDFRHSFRGPRTFVSQSHALALVLSCTKFLPDIHSCTVVSFLGRSAAVSPCWKGSGTRASFLTLPDASILQSYRPSQDSWPCIMLVLLLTILVGSYQLVLSKISLSVEALVSYTAVLHTITTVWY